MNKLVLIFLICIIVFVILVLPSGENPIGRDTTEEPVEECSSFVIENGVTSCFDKYKPEGDSD